MSKPEKKARKKLFRISSKKASKNTTPSKWKIKTGCQAILCCRGKRRIEIRYSLDLYDTLTITQAVIFYNTKRKRAATMLALTLPSKKSQFNGMKLLSRGS